MFQFVKLFEFDYQQFCTRGKISIQWTDKRIIFKSLNEMKASSKVHALCNASGNIKAL